MQVSTQNHREVRVIGHPALSYHRGQLRTWLWFNLLSTRHRISLATCATALVQVAFMHIRLWLLIVALLTLGGCDSISKDLSESGQRGHASPSIAPEEEASSRLELSLSDQAVYSNELATCYYQSNSGEDEVPTGISIKAPRCPTHIIYDFSNNAWIDASRHR